MGWITRTPPPALAGLVESIWDWQVPPGPHRYDRVLPKPGAQLIVNLHEDQTRVYSDDAERRCTRASGSVLGGPTLASQIIDSAEQIRVMGVVFRRGGAYAFCGEDQRQLLGRDVDLFDLFGAAGGRLRERLLDAPGPTARLDLLQAWLLRQWRVPALEPAVLHVADALDRVPQWARIGPLVRATGWSDERFGECFRRQIGMGPKRYARLQRFRAALVQIHRQREIDWCRVAADGGFTDQAHLVREFRAFAGITPGELARRRGVHLNHLAVD